MIYTGEFLNKENDIYRIELITSSDLTETSNIKLCTDPFIVNYNGNEDVFKPLKLSGATVSCWVDNYMFDLYSGQAKGTKCILYKGDNIEWQGYVSPNIYNQDYMQNKFELKIECVDGLSILESIKYKTDNKKIISFLGLIKKILLDTGYNYSQIYVHKFSSEKLDNLFISECNFFDENDEAMTCKDVLENILQYLNLTMFQFRNVIYIVDYNLIKDAYYQFDTYNLNNSSVGSANLFIDDIELIDNIIYQTPTLSFTDTYNQISLESSQYYFDINYEDLFDANNLEKQTLYSDEYLRMYQDDK